MPHAIELFGTAVLTVAVAHTFSVGFFRKLASAYRAGSFAERFFHVLGEVELVFALWSVVLLLGIVFGSGIESAFQYLKGLHFREPAFVFVVMAMAATRPVIGFVESVILRVASVLPLAPSASLYAVTLVLGPLMGSCITEPAAMAVTASILKRSFFNPSLSASFRYGTLAVLFVNISVGGVLTHFAAPPVLMVAGAWGWTLSHVFLTFGWKAILAVIGNALLATFFFRRELLGIELGMREPLPTARLRDSFFVSIFLAGLVVLGGLQGWWLAPILANLSPGPLFLGTTLLTGITDNAALTYLGTQVPSLSNSLKYSLVAGAVAGGGLTVIGNAPNPAGYAILQARFGPSGIRPLPLFLAAIPFTLIAMACFWWLP